MTELGIDQPIVVGHSIPGAIASIYGAPYPALGIVKIDQPVEIRPIARMVRDLWPALLGEHFAKAAEPIRQSIGLDRIPEPIRSRVLAIPDIRQDLVLGYWDELRRTDPDDIQARIDDTARRITCPYLVVFGRALAPSDGANLVPRGAGVQIGEWPDSAHCVHLARLGRFTSRLRAFINPTHRKLSKPAPTGVDTPDPGLRRSPGGLWATYAAVSAAFSAGTSREPGSP